MNERTNNYRIQAESARAIFLDYDQNEMISRIGLHHDAQFLHISFFRERYRIDRVTGKVTRFDDDSPATFNAVMSIYDALCHSKPDSKLSGEWRTLNNLSPHSNFGASGRDMYCHAAERFSGRIDDLRRICKELGGFVATKADVGFCFEAFTFLPIIFQFWEGDDEFTPKLGFLFDSNTLNYIHFETAWYVAEYLLGLLETKMPPL